VRFTWGPFQFDGIIEKMGRKVTLFQPDGTPARATLSVTFKEYRTLQNQMQNPRRESADKSKRRVVVGRDSLWALAWREYADVTQWRFIADANDLDDPRDIAAGDWLILPPLEQSSGTG
jgi:nucleoid-associated protein YgaU